MSELRWMLVAAVSAGSAACSLLLSPYAGLALAASASLAFVFLSRSRARRIDREAVRLVSNMVEARAAGATTLASISGSLTASMPFRRELEGAVREYRLSGDAAGSFSSLSGSGSRCLDSLYGIVVNSLDNGAEMLPQLKELEREARDELALGDRVAGAVSGGLAVIRFGSALFLPVFAGISLEIFGFASGVNSALEGVSRVGLEAVLALFIAFINLAGPGRRAPSRPKALAGSCASAAVAISVFRLSSVLGGFMLR